MTKFVECVDQTNDEDSSLDIFQQIALPSGSERHKYHFQWWGKHGAMFHIVGFLSHQISSIIGS
jgi:hypothetical protein